MEISRIIVRKKESEEIIPAGEVYYLLNNGKLYHYILSIMDKIALRSYSSHTGWYFRLVTGCLVSFQRTDNITHNFFTFDNVGKLDYKVMSYRYRHMEGEPNERNLKQFINNL